ANAPRTARAKRDFFISYSKYCYLSKYFYRPTTPYCPLDNGTYLNKKHTGGTTATPKNRRYDNDVTFFCNALVRQRSAVHYFGEEIVFILNFSQFFRKRRAPGGALKPSCERMCQA